MTVQYDPENWLVTATRSLASYVEEQFDDNIVDVEIGFPDTLNLLPLPKLLIHFEQDHIANPVLGFGTPGKEVFDDIAHTWLLQEAQVHEINFDVGVWASKETGGVTARMQAVQKLTDTFARPEGKKAMMVATGGLWVVSFTGGRNEIDRLDDVPVWRALDMTLMLRVVSRHLPALPEVAVGDFDQDQELTIINDGGVQSPVS